MRDDEQQKKREISDRELLEQYWQSQLAVATAQQQSIDIFEELLRRRQQAETMAREFRREYEHVYGTGE